MKITYIPDDDLENTFTIDIEDMRIVALVNRIKYYSDDMSGLSSIIFSHDGRILSKIETSHSTPRLSLRRLKDSIEEYSHEILNQLFSFDSWSK